MRSLAEIASEMEALVPRGDIEAQHERADALLIEAIRHPAAAFHLSAVDRLVDAWVEVGKWYS